MFFNSFLGLFFSLGVVLVHWNIPKRIRNTFLLIASFCFYGYGDPLYLLLLIGVILVSFFSGQIIETSKKPRTIVAIAIALLIGILGIFKYFNFFTESFAGLLAQFGFRVDAITLAVLLPVGISFYTFQSVSYLIDVYRRTVVAERNIIDFALFISFFPQLVAGPIERSNNLLKQVKQHRPELSSDDISYGVFLIVQGYVKKVVIADTLGGYADLLFQQDQLSGPFVVVGLLFFSLQIYGDFSGYTDIARGYSRLLGFKIILNFDRPYFASSPSNFWRRWHISLSSWFTEYVYIPLGGNRSNSKLRRLTNVLLTMTISGLWHGAALSFILWGFYHGTLIAFQRILRRFSSLDHLNSRLLCAPSRILTFVLVAYGWLFFRVDDFDKLYSYNRSLFSDWSGDYEAILIFSQGIVCVVSIILIDILEKYWIDVHRSGIKRNRGLSFYLAALIVFIYYFANGSSGSFIYFRF